jgi:hypothetical protein
MNLALSGEPIPFGPRALSRSELIRLDIYAFESPKLGRRVTVVRPTALALALDHEFNPDIPVYVERPRVLVFESGKVELSFWTSTRKGLEQFSLLTTAIEGTSGQARAAKRRAEAIQAAAQNAQIALRQVPEAQLLRQAIENVNRLRLLPWVQSAKALPKAAEIEGRVLERFEFQPRLGLSQIEHALATFDGRDVRAVVCRLVHAGRLKLDLSTRLNAHSMVELGVAP